MQLSKNLRIEKIVRNSNYQLSPRDYKKLWLDKNENNHSILEKIIKKFTNSLKFEDFFSYPNFKKLYEIISKTEHLKKENILITNGADGSIKLIFESLIEEKDEIIITFPSFAMYDVYSKLYNLKINKFHYKKKNNKFILDLNKIKNKIQNKNIKAFFLPNPDSPSGFFIQKKEIKNLLNLCKQNKTYLVIDEAYYPFSKITLIDLIKKFDNLLVIRSGSKSFGLAGLRVGFVASNKKNINLISKFKPIYEISSLSGIFYYYMYLNIAKIKKLCKDLLSDKIKFENFLLNQKFEVIHTYGNFILVNFGKKRKKINRLLKNYAYIKNDIIIDGINYSRITITEFKNLSNIKKLIKNVYR